MRKTQKLITIVSVGVSLLISCNSETKCGKSDLPKIQVDTVLENVSLDYDVLLWTEIDFEKDGIIDSMAYADTANFTREKIYPCSRCFLRPEAAKALMVCNKKLAKEGLQLVLFDCYRPTMYQQKMFDIVQNPNYVAEPKAGGSMHNKGLAVDIALANSSGKMLDFGGNFDEFSERSHHDYKALDTLARNNRLLLKEVMIEAGFQAYPYEWWHYSFNTVDYELDDFIWHCD